MSDTLLRKTLAEDPLNTGVRLQLANLLTLAGRYREAEQILCEGITAGDAHRDLLMQHGESLLDTDQPELAVTRFREVLQLVPNNADALASLGGALLRIGAHAEAAAVLSRAANCLPHDAVVHELWGEALAAIDCRQEAARAFQHAWGLQRRTRAIAFFCGNVACDQGNFALAIEMFTAGTELPGDEPVPWHNLGKSCFEVGDVTAATLAFRQSLAIDRPIGMRNLALIIAGDPTATHTDVKNVRSEYAQMIAIPDNGWQPRVRNPRHPAGPLRIGYVSSFFAFPNYMKPVYAVLQAHDRSTVDIELFHDGPPSPELVACFENSAVSMVHEVSASSNTQLVDCIRSRNLDVLVDLNGYSAMQRLAIYTVRLASHVIGWFNHFGPASLPGIDCLVGDTQTMHEAEKPFYDEQLVQLPLSYLAFHVSHPAPDIVSPPCCTADHITFGSLCTQYKVTPDVLRGWARLLRDVPRSRLILANRTLESDDVATYVSKSLEREGISSNRISLRGGATHFDYLKNYNDIDISLDPWPYNGGTTTTESIWQGVPVLTFRGDRWASRTSASLLADGPFSAFAHDSQEEMLQFAISFAASPTASKYLSDLRLTARPRLLNSSVCDVTRLARSLEQEFVASVGLK